MSILSEQLPSGQNQTEPKGADRRRSHRQEVETIGCLRLAEDLREAGRQVRVVDVSLHGVGVRTMFPLELDQVFHIDIGAGPLRLASRMRVVRVRQLDDGGFDIGGEFC